MKHPSAAMLAGAIACMTLSHIPAADAVTEKVVYAFKGVRRMATRRSTL
ncbi:MAG TPA: hypothetical protein VMF67_17920 [Rhizomicrobium sp.]|nr:hypothetical protein [Rhizomicrobium sp.]